MICPIITKKKKISFEIETKTRQKRKQQKILAFCIYILLFFLCTLFLRSKIKPKTIKTKTLHYQSNSMIHTTSLPKKQTNVVNASEDEERLVRDLFRGYNKLIRPVQNMTQKVGVRFGLAFVQLINVVSVCQLQKLQN